MKKLFAILTFLLIFTACSSSTQPVSRAVTETSVTADTATPKPTSTPTPTPSSTLVPEPTSTPAPSEMPVPTDTPMPVQLSDDQVSSETLSEHDVGGLFNDVYAWYADNQFSLEYQYATMRLNGFDYKFETVDPSEEDIGQVKVYSNDSDDYVWMSFFPYNGVELLTQVSFYQASTNREVSVSNFSENRAPQYSKYDVHIIGSEETTVSSIQEQRSFLLEN